MRPFIMIALVAMGIATMTACDHKKTEESNTATDSAKTEMSAPDTTATVSTPDTTAMTDSVATPAPSVEEAK